MGDPGVRGKVGQQIRYIVSEGLTDFNVSGKIIHETYHRILEPAQEGPEPTSLAGEFKGSALGILDLQGKILRMERLDLKSRPELFQGKLPTWPS